MNMQQRKFEVTGNELKYENPWMKVLEYQTKTDGKPGIYGVVNRPDSSTIIVEAHDGSILFVRQYRFPTGEFSWELPMGGLDAGESPNVAAVRELEEETGICVNLKKIGEFRPVPGLTPQKASVFYGIVSDDDVRKLSLYSATVDEIVERRFITVDEIKSMIERHEISDGFTLSSLSIFWWR